ncbi:VanZ family protein [Ruminiclostridium papyrosolvens]|uniref:VanZ-like domain-containing protein n=1 Tax=Ruminiclostridium papyrosolvens C7 TaxID=1330534 RepID=U4QZH3_9FIRM|nr:VanZ family protein [Ruminiclostridium papyrosolvens]EPR09415.1 hypothetical protein L323_17500 [Ruminiclostridium papyrosolvens C7]
MPNKKLILISLRFIFWGLFILYLLIIVNVIVFKDGKALIMAEFGRQIPLSQRITSINYIPFINTIIPYLKGEPSTRIAMENILGNTVAFSPFGFFLPVLFRFCKRFTATILLSICFSLLIELVQFIFCLGSCDIDDIILNVLGSLLGYGVYRLFRSLYFNTL